MPRELPALPRPPSITCGTGVTEECWTCAVWYAAAVHCLRKEQGVCKPSLQYLRFAACGRQVPVVHVQSAALVYADPTWQASAGPHPGPTPS